MNFQDRQILKNKRISGCFGLGGVVTAEKLLIGVGVLFRVMKKYSYIVGWLPNFVIILKII